MKIISIIMHCIVSGIFIYILLFLETTNQISNASVHLCSHVFTSTVYVDYGVVIMFVTLAAITVIGTPFCGVLKLSICLCSAPIFLIFSPRVEVETMRLSLGP